MKLDDIEQKMYNLLINDYTHYGMDMCWTMKNGDDIELQNMEDSHIKNCINMLSKKVENGSRKAWIDIFRDVQLKRRINKINKIKLRICQT